MAATIRPSVRRVSLRDLRTAVSSRIRSKPTIEGQRYLDLYVLQRDRFRWLRLKTQAENSINSIDEALRGLGFHSGEGASDAIADAGRAPHATGAGTLSLGAAAKRKKSA